MKASVHLMLFRLAIELAVACVIVLLLPPARPPFAAVACSLTAGAGVALVLARRLPRASEVREAGTRRLVAALYFSLRAFAEEAFWRGFVFAVALPRAGLLSAAAFSVAGFAAIHVPNQGRSALVHVVTGAAFLLCYLGGGLWAAVAAHVAYDLTFLTLVSARRRALRPT